MSQLFPLRSGGTLTKQATDLDIELIEGNLQSSRNIKSFVKGFILLCKTIRLKDPAIVHFLPLSNFGSLAGLISSAKYTITSRRGLIKLNYLKKRWRLLDKISNFLSNKIIVNSEAIIDEMINIDSVDLDKVICIRNGINLEKFNVKDYCINDMRSAFSLSDSDFAWAKVANFSSIKGHKDLINAFKNIHIKYNSKLFLIGKDNGTLNELKDLVLTLDLDSKIKFLGFRDDIQNSSGYGWLYLRLSY